MVEKVNEEIILVYTSPAFPPEGIDINEAYRFGKDGKGTFIVSNGEKRYEKIEFIKTFFTPYKNGWENVLGTK